MKFSNRVFDELIVKNMAIPLKKMDVKNYVSSIFLGVAISSYTKIDQKKYRILIKKDEILEFVERIFNYYDLDYRVVTEGIRKDNILKVLSSKYFNENLIYSLKKINIQGLVFGLIIFSKISNPEKEYRITVNVDIRKFSNILQSEQISLLENHLETLREYLLENGISHIFTEYKGEYILKFNTKDSISNLLALLNLTSSVLEFENIVLEREIKGDINRKINFEVANLQRTILAATKQLNTIKEIRKRDIFDKLNDNYKSIIVLRENNPEDSVSKLSKLAKKSSATILNYFKKMEEILKEEK